MRLGLPLGLGFQPVLLPVRGANEPSPSARRKGRFGPVGLDSNGRLGAALEGLLLGRAPPARGLPLLVVKGRARPPSLRRGRAELERPVLGRPAPVLPELDRPEPE